jgi:hypothetical protein
MGNKDKQAIIKAASHPARTMPLSLSLLKLLFCETLKTEASPQLLTLIPLLLEPSFEDYFFVLIEPSGASRWKSRKILLSIACFTCCPFNPFGAEQRIKKKSANM